MKPDLGRNFLLPCFAAARNASTRTNSACTARRDLKNPDSWKFDQDGQERMVRFAPEGIRWPWSLGKIGEEC